MKRRSTTCWVHRRSTTCSPRHLVFQKNKVLSLWLYMLLKHFIYKILKTPESQTKQGLHFGIHYNDNIDNKQNTLRLLKQITYSFKNPRSFLQHEDINKIQFYEGPTMQGQLLTSRCSHSGDILGIRFRIIPGDACLRSSR